MMFLVRFFAKDAMFFFVRDRRCRARINLRSGSREMVWKVDKNTCS